jgi:peptidyl-tRNA hydrolase, PTH2 family
MKQVIVVNDSLKLPKGKLAAQVAHAAVAAFLMAGEKTRKAWLKAGMPKVVLKGENEEELLKLETMAQQQGIPAQLIRDAGRTVVPEGTITCLGLGPAPEPELDRLTGSLKLLR